MLRPMRPGVLALGLMTSLALTGPAFAQPAVEACVASFSDGQIQQKRGKLADAIRVYAECATPTCPTQVREDCARKRAEVERSLPTVLIVVRDANGRDAPVKITVDGVIFDTSGGSARPIDPGPHTIAFGPEGSKPREEKVIIVEGEKNRSIVLAWNDVAPRADDKSAPPTEEHKHEQTPVRPEPPPPSRSMGPYLVGGLGILGLVVGVGIFVSASTEESRGTVLRGQASQSRAAGDDVQAFNYDSAADSRFTAAENNRLLGTFFLIPSALLIGGAVVWYILDTPKKKAAVLPALGPGYAGLGGSF